MHTIEELFPIKIYRTHYDKINELKASLLPKLEQYYNPEKNHALMSNDNISTYHEHRQINNWDETKEFIEFLNVHIQNYWQELNYHPELTPYILEMWANRSYKGGWVYTHTHSPNPIVGTCYLSVSEDMGNLFFQDPLEMVLSSQPCNTTNFTEFEKEIPLVAGDIVLFPGYLRHRTYPNKTDEPRIVLSFNIGCTGTYLTHQWVTK